MLDASGDEEVPLVPMEVPLMPNRQQAPLYGNDDPSIASRADQPFKTASLLTMDYKIHNASQIDTIKGDATVFGNSMVKVLACVPGLVVCGPCVMGKFVKIFEVPQGSIQPFADGRGGFGFFGPGLHRVVDPALELKGGVCSLTDAIIRNGNL